MCNGLEKKERSRFKMKKVSIVVPAYNAETTIGRCLNSILSQSFTEYEVIIINDGSTDNTLKICKNYTGLDNRFSVFTVKNGGVSNARNIGVEKASGKFLTFVDSDDMIHPDYLKEMVTAAEKYKTDLAISDLVFIDFGRPENRIVLTGKSYISKIPVVLTREEFKKKTMELIWKTSLLESGCGKLVRLGLWKKYHIKLDNALSLGEDFSANLEYYRHINSVVFLNKPLYYYENIDNSDSLSHKYRQDVFEIRMKLVDNLKDYLGDIEKLPKKEKECFYNYVTAYGINSLESVINTRRYQGYRERLGEIEKIVNNDLFRDALSRATYIKNRSWKSLILDRNIKKLASERPKLKRGEKTGTWKNRMARRAMRFYFCDIKKNHRRGEEVDKKLSTVGIKNTLKDRLRGDK